MKGRSSLPTLCFIITALGCAGSEIPRLPADFFPIRQRNRMRGGHTPKGTKGAFGRSPLQPKPEPKPIRKNARRSYSHWPR